MKFRSLPPILSAVLLASALGAAASFAQTTLKVAVIDTERILLESQAGKVAIGELKKLQDQKEAELQAKQNEVRDLQAKINEGSLSLAQARLDEMRKQLEDAVIAGRRLSDDANRDLTKRRDELLGAVDQRVMPLINQMGREMGYTLIFRKFESGLIFADDAVDITKQVIERLDAAAAQGR